LKILGAQLGCEIEQFGCTRQVAQCERSPCKVVVGFERIRIETQRFFEFGDRLVVTAREREREPARGMRLGQLRRYLDGAPAGMFRSCQPDRTRIEPLI